MLHEYHTTVWLKYSNRLFGFLSAIIPIYLFILMFTEWLAEQIAVLGLE